jgi:two-component system chemotaxis response regulator CheB
MQTERFRVLVVDDSGFMRRMVADMIGSSVSFAVAGTACNGQEAVQKVLELKPDVVTMDIEMPGMDGLTALEQIMRRQPTPVVMLSSLTGYGAEETVRSLELGAVDFVCKPSGSLSVNVTEIKYLLLSKLRAAARAKLVPPRLQALTPRVKAAPHDAAQAAWVVAIGSSTGGPRALEEVLPRLPGDLPAAVVAVQHMPQGFTGAMADRLNSFAEVEIREAAEGDSLSRGTALIAPGGRHLVVNEQGRVTLTAEPPVWGVRPAVDLMMNSIAKVYGARTVGVILTGMGRDGASGMRAIRDRGGRTLGQDEETCVIYGMPKEAVAAGGVEMVIPLPEIADKIAELLAAAHAGLARPQLAVEA